MEAKKSDLQCGLVGLGRRKVMVPTKFKDSLSWRKFFLLRGGFILLFCSDLQLIG